MKKFAAAGIFLLLLALPVIYFNRHAAASLSGDGYLYEDIPLVQDGSGYYIRERTEGGHVVMLPLSSVLYEYADISFDGDSGTVSVVCGTLDVTLKIGETGYMINGERAQLDAPPEIIGGLTYVPATFFEKTFGFWITGDGDGFIDLFMPSFIIDNI